MKRRKRGGTPITILTTAHQRVVCSPQQQYPKLIAELKAGVSRETRFQLCKAAFEHTARYDGMVAQWLSQPRLSLCRTATIST